MFFDVHGRARSGWKVYIFFQSGHLFDYLCLAKNLDGCVCGIFIVIAVFCEDVKYLGCYVDSSNRDLDGFLSPSSSSMTINTCIATCKAKGEYSSFYWSKCLSILESFHMAQCHRIGRGTEVGKSVIQLFRCSAIFKPPIFW